MTTPRCQMSRRPSHHLWGAIGLVARKDDRCTRTSMSTEQNITWIVVEQDALCPRSPGVHVPALLVFMFSARQVVAVRATAQVLFVAITTSAICFASCTVTKRSRGTSLCATRRLLTAHFPSWEARRRHGRRQPPLSQSQQNPRQCLHGVIAQLGGLFLNVALQHLANTNASQRSTRSSCCRVAVHQRRPAARRGQVCQGSTSQYSPPGLY